TSAPLAQTVFQANTTTTVGSLVNPSLPGQTVTFTAIVTAVFPGGGTPTGTVTFRDSGNTLGTAPLNNGTATFATSPLTAGSHAIIAVYSDDFHSASTSSPLPQPVFKASSATSVSSFPNPSLFGQTVTFTATVSAVFPASGTPTGTVTFRDSGNTIGSAF